MSDNNDFNKMKDSGMAQMDAMKKPGSSPTNLLIGLAALVLIVGLGGVYMNNQSNEQKKKDDDAALMRKKDDDKMAMEKDKMKKDEAMKMEMMKKDPAMMMKESMAKLSGTYTGQAALLTQSLSFPKATFTLANSDMTLTAQGLDLAILQKPELQVNGVYPKVKLDVKGMVNPKADGTADLVVTSLVPVFIVTANGADTVLDAATSQAIIAGLAQAGLVIPVVSATAPATIPATITPTATGLSIKSSTNSPLFAMFDGSKTV
jgi:hypothetical protein